MSKATRCIAVGGAVLFVVCCRLECVVPGSGAQKGLQDAVGAYECVGGDALVGAVRERGIPGAEVDRLDSRGGEFCHRRPRLLGLYRALGGGEKAVQEGVLVRRAGAGGVAEHLLDLAIGLAPAAQRRLGLLGADIGGVAEG